MGGNIFIKSLFHIHPQQFSAKIPTLPVVGLAVLKKHFLVPGSHGPSFKRYWGGVVCLLQYTTDNMRNLLMALLIPYRVLLLPGLHCLLLRNVISKAKCAAKAGTSPYFIKCFIDFRLKCVGSLLVCSKKVVHCILLHLPVSQDKWFGKKKSLLHVQA